MAKDNLAELQIVFRKLSEMHPNPKNPRKQGDDGIVPLAESIEKNPQFFIARPILLSDRTGKLVIIGGERRYEAALYLEMTEAPSIILHGLTEEKEDEIMLRDNTHSGKWNEEKLRKWTYDQLNEYGVLNWSGIEKKDLKELFEQNEKKEEKQNIITIEIPADLDAEQIKDTISSELLNLYPNCKIK